MTSPRGGGDAEAQAYLWFERLRWGQGPDRCPHCDALGGFTFLRPANGVSRRTRTGAASCRRVWRCRECRRQFSVLTGTVFESSRVPLSTWAAVLAVLVRGDTPSPAAVAVRYSISAETARHVLARLAAARAQL